MRLPVLALLAASLCAGQAAEEGKPASSNIMNAEYPKVYADLSAAFRLKAPDAQKVQVDIMAKKYDMTKGADGVWTVKIPPQVVGFQWDVSPALTGKEFWLLALVTAANDKLSTTELDIGVLVPQQTKCALKKVRTD